MKKIDLTIGIIIVRFSCITNNTIIEMEVIGVQQLTPVMKSIETYCLSCCMV